ncbi:MAG: DegV family EDD domain-containing protein [Butyrivibrio sp.]|nr:DegV family EDD domain-containing protein [Butyrivibrio sp.]
MKSILSKIKSRLYTESDFFDVNNIMFMSVGGELSLIVGLVFDIIIREHIVEIALLAGMAAILPIMTMLCVFYNKVFMFGRVQVIILAYVVVPITFFFGGGPKGGGIFWIGFTYMYIGVILAGAWRQIMMFVFTLVVFLEYAVYLFKPEWIYQHNDMQMEIDSAVGALMVGILIYATLVLQKRMFDFEYTKVQEKTKNVEELNYKQNRFFSSMSHEIRTPINSILGLNELILRNSDASTEIKKNAANIQGAGRMLLTLVNDILDLSKIEAGKMEIVPVNYSLSDMISEIVNMVWLRAEQKGLKFTVDIDPSLPAELFGDEVRVKQILINILNNAVKYTQEGSVSLHIECNEIRDGKVYIVFSITDTGMGIKQESLPHLFDAFQRVDEEKNRHIEGTGLGLSIVKQLVDLMNGEIKVNSVYTQGSTFSIYLWQGISNDELLGTVNIKNYEYSEKTQNYKPGFIAKNARILIVDDNEMNLEVEKQLLTDTKMKVDLALSGEEALEMTLSNRYDVILMDHLMPEMDGIECLGRIRRQTGGFNKQTPIIALTANAGSENRELYARSGFDDYLVKPVSGFQLEELLVKHLPEEKVVLTENGDALIHEMNTASGYSRKMPVLIATSSMCDIPLEVLKNIQIDIIPFSVNMDGKTFWDGIEAGSDELVHYLKENTRKLDSEPPTVEAFESFFAEGLKRAHHIIYISITTSMSKEYERASEAAKTFDNVSVVNSGFISSSTGIMVLSAYQMAKRNVQPARIVEELENFKKQLHCSFIVADTQYLMRREYISNIMHTILSNLSLRVYLKIKRNKFGLGGIIFGNQRKCYKTYIKHALSLNKEPDNDILFITYVDIPEDTLLWIEEKVRKRFNFNHIIFHKASAAISLNCGPGSFGLLYMDKGNYSYNLSSFFELLNEDGDSLEDEMVHEENEKKDNNVIHDIKTITDSNVKNNEIPWYDSIEGINGDAAIKNSGSEEAFRTVLKIFYDSISQKADDIEMYYQNQDWDNYTIKVHALKSSAKLIGALELSEKAEKLENAGKKGSFDYIIENNADMMKDLLNYHDILCDLIEDNVEKSNPDKPVADKELMDSAYEAIVGAAKEMDCDMLEQVFDELKDYSIPDSDKERFNSIKKASENFDYEGILKLLSET